MFSKACPLIHIWIHVWKYLKRTQREDLPQQDAVRPDVTFECVHTLKDTLGRHPLHRETGLHKTDVYFEWGRFLGWVTSNVLTGKECLASFLCCFRIDFVFNCTCWNITHTPCTKFRYSSDCSMAVWHSRYVTLKYELPLIHLRVNFGSLIWLRFHGEFSFIH